jgi:hypothetical protein
LVVAEFQTIVHLLCQRAGDYEPRTRHTDLSHRGAVRRAAACDATRNQTSSKRTQISGLVRLQAIETACGDASMTVVSAWQGAAAVQRSLSKIRKKVQVRGKFRRGGKRVLR